VDGTSGSSGTSGTTGVSGTSGTSGTTGTSGSSGTSGTSATDGTGGTSGTSGTSATNGTGGTSGTSGTSGANGINGTSGTSGVNGAVGSSGTSGTSGTSGLLGSATSPLFISSNNITIQQASGSQNGFLSSTDWNTFNNKANSVVGGYLPLSGGTLTGPLGGTSISLSGDITANRYRGVNSLVLNSYTTVNPSSNVYLYSPGNDRDAWIYLDSADTGSNWGIYHRQIDSAVSGLPANSIGFIGGGASTLQAWISLANGNGFFAGDLTANNLSGTNTGNVTIGTANGLSLSGQALSLGLASGSANGALSSTDWTTFNNKQNALTNPVTGTGTSGQVAYFNGTTSITSESNLFWDATNDRLGINNASPSVALDLGNTGGQKFYNYNGGVGNRNGSGLDLGGFAYEYSMFFAFGESDNGRMTFGSLNGTTYSTKMTILGNGNVGINTTSDAGFKLDVSGTGRFSGDYGGSPGLTVSGTTYGVFGANRGITNASSGVNYLSVGTQKWFSGIYENSDNFGIYSTGTGGFPLIINHTTGNIGIGTDSLNVKLQIGDKTLVRTGDSSWGQFAVANPNDAEVGITWGAGGTGYPGITSTYTRQWIAGLNPFGTGMDRWSLTNRTLGANAAITVLEGGNVGIGTIGPSFKLDVNGTARVSGTSVLPASFISSGNETIVAIQNTGPNGRNYFLIAGGNGGTFNSGQFGIYDATASLPRLSITSAGNVGIGFVNPALKLSLGNDVGRKFFVYDDGGGSNDIGGGMGTDLGGFSAETSIFFGNFSGSGRLSIGAWTSSQTYSTKLTVLANGNVMIGTTTDNGNRFQVNGSASFSNNQNTTSTYTFQNTDTTDTNSRLVLNLISGNSSLSFRSINNDHNYIASSSGQHLIFQQFITGPTNLRINSNGNILIGTDTDNGTKLQVNGAIITSNPSGDTARPFKVGGVNNESDKSFAGNILKVEVNGTIYRLMIAE
jgi:hypothetical protein